MALPALSCLLYRRGSRMTFLSRILFTFVLAVLLPVYLLVYSFFIMMLLYFCLFVDHVNKSIVFVALVYHFYVQRNNIN